MEAVNWLWLAIAAGVVAVLYGVVSVFSILRLPAGSARWVAVTSSAPAIVADTTWVPATKPWRARSP